MPQRLLMAVLIGMIGMIGMLGYIAYMSAATNTSARPKSYRAAVMRVLELQQVEYRDVRVADGCAPSYQLCRFYTGKVRIIATTTMSGQIDCRERWITCTLTVPQVGISGVALDDTIDPLTARWEDVYGQFLLWLRSVSVSFAQRN